MLIVSPVTRFARSMVRKWLVATKAKNRRYEKAPTVSRTRVGLSNVSARSARAIPANTHETLRQPRWTCRLSVPASAISSASIVSTAVGRVPGNETHNDRPTSRR
jgi:hypothetical protein